MSKKSRKRNKKILAALALAGGAAMLAKGRGTAAAANVDSGRGSGLRDTVDSTKNWINKKADVASNAAAEVADRTSVPIGRMHGAGSDADAIAGQKIRAAYAQKGRGINPHEQTLAAGNAYVPRIPRVHSRIPRAKGGRVTGIAKRGFGRALMKGKK